MIYRILALAAMCLLSAGCGNGPAGSASNDADIGERARQIADSAIIIDTHIDVPYRLNSKPADVSNATADGDFDHPRAVAGGLNVPFMSIYTPARLESEGRSREVADSLIDMVEQIASDAPAKFALAYSVADVREQFESGVLSLPLGMENGSPIEGDLRNLQHFYDRGIRYITLTHSLSNHISDSSYDDRRQWNGLSEFGVKVIEEMNRLGIMVDVSHVSDDAFWQILEVSDTPPIASHSSARHFTPDFERNMSDEMIVALANKGGVIHVNFGSSFLTQAAMEYSDQRAAARKQYLSDNPGLEEEHVYETFSEIYAKEHGPFPFASLDDVLDHFDHVVSLVGVEYVGIGSDFDGVGDSLPVGIKDVADYPNLVAGLLERGYSEAEIRKILGENLLRVWQAAEDYAATTSSRT